MSDAQLLRRDRKRLANRELIHVVAMRLFNERGFDSVSIEQVADAADVSASTVYRNFPTKEDLVLARLAARQVDLLDEIDRQPGGGTVADLVVAAVAAWAPSPDEIELVRSEVALVVATPALLGRMQQMIADWEVPIVHRLASRCGRPENDLEVCQLAVLLCGTIRIVLREWAGTSDAPDMVEFGTESLKAIHHLPVSQLPIS